MNDNRGTLYLRICRCDCLRVRTCVRVQRGCGDSGMGRGSLPCTKAWEPACDAFTMQKKKKKKNVISEKKGNMSRLLTYRAKAGVLGVNIGVGMRRGEGEVDSVRMRKRGDGVRTRKVKSSARWANLTRWSGGPGSRWSGTREDATQPMTPLLLSTAHPLQQLGMLQNSARISSKGFSTQPQRVMTQRIRNPPQYHPKAMSSTQAPLSTRST